MSAPPAAFAAGRDPAAGQARRSAAGAGRGRSSHPPRPWRRFSSPRHWRHSTPRVGSRPAFVVMIGKTFLPGAARSDVLFVGTGLTMIDQVLTLERRGHRGRILAVSRRGLLPCGHSTPRPAPVDPRLPPDADLRGLVRAVHACAAGVTAAGGDWQAVIDGLRPLTQALWHGLGPVDRRRFLRHVAPYWSVLRHRMAPEVAARVARLRQAGRLEVIAGRILGLEAAESRGAAFEAVVEHVAGPRAAEGRFAGLRPAEERWPGANASGGHIAARLRPRAGCRLADGLGHGSRRVDAIRLRAAATGPIQRPARISARAERLIERILSGMERTYDI
jgi:hypothetical protein